MLKSFVVEIGFSPGARGGYRAPSGGQSNFAFFTSPVVLIFRKKMSPPKKMGYRSPFEPKFEGTSIFTDDVK